MNMNTTIEIRQTEAKKIFENNDRLYYNQIFHKNIYNQNLLPHINVFKRNPTVQIFQNEKFKDFFRDNFHFEACLNNLSSFYSIWKDIIHLLSNFIHHSDTFFQYFSFNFFQSPLLDSVYFKIKNLHYHHYQQVNDEYLFSLAYFNLQHLYKENNQIDTQKITTIIQSKFLSKEILEFLFTNNYFSINNNKTNYLINSFIEDMFGKDFIFFIKRDFIYKTLNLIKFFTHLEELIIKNHYSNSLNIKYLIELNHDDFDYHIKPILI